MTSVVPSGPRDGSVQAEILTRFLGTACLLASASFAAFFVQINPAPRHMLFRDSANDDSSASMTFGQRSCPLDGVRP